MNQQLRFDYLEQFKQQSGALRLLRSANFSLLASFFYGVFIQHNRRSVGYQELVALLDYHLLDLAESYGADKFPKPARAYIDDWINLKGGYLRKYLPNDSDEPECDLLPDVEKALRWLEEMQGRRFVGTESRLKLLLNLITDLVQGTTEDKASKLASLKAKQADLAAQIVAVEEGMDLGLSATEVRERLFLLSDISRQLLGDFRQVEANFRQLDKATRKKITLGGIYKGEVLDQVFGDQDVIDGSDEGKSFSSFFELLMTPDMRDNMRGDLKQLLRLPQGKEMLSSDELLQQLYGFLLDAGTKVNTTKQQITDQLRRYIQEQSQDNKRILELIRQFESQAQRVEFKRANTMQEFAHIEGIQADIDTLFSRQLYRPKLTEQLETMDVETPSEPNVDLTSLFDVSRIDEGQLQRNIGACLNHHHGQVNLAQVVAQYPIEYGLDEVLTYLKLACEQRLPAHIDSQQQQLISWYVSANTQHRLNIPLVTFVRELN